MRPPLPLRPETLHRHAKRLAVPGYDRSALRPSIVHLSVGSFHRSHQAVYFDELARQGSRDWGIVGVGLRRPAMREALAAQGGLYTVLTRGQEGDDARVVGVMPRYLLAPLEREQILAALAAEDAALVTLTVTGDGYGAPARVEDSAEPARARRGAPSTAIEYLVEALDRRRRAGRAPFTVLSCDNLPRNGVVAHNAVVGLAAERSDQLADWIRRNVAFPSGMVDRITPKTTAADRDLLARRFGVWDRWPVVTEPFSQWILEDRFSGARPPLERAGVQFVDDVRPYSLMKTRLLNATHCAIGHLGSLAGLRRADEVVREPAFRDYITLLMEQEVTPLLPPVPGVDLDRYRQTVVERLGNDKIRDDLARLCRAGSSKLAAHVVPSIEQAREQRRPHRLLTLAVAGWVRYLRGTDERGCRLDLDDPAGGRLRTLALRSGRDPHPLLAERSLFGDLGEDERFVAEVRDALIALERHGVRGALAAATAGGRRVAA